jgi:hypothetical protein
MAVKRKNFQIQNPIVAFQAFIKKINEFCKSSSADKTPLQNKKRPKNLSPIVDEEDDGVQTNNNTVHSTTASAVNSESEESMSKTGPALQPLRAVRTAKLKAAGSLVSFLCVLLHFEVTISDVLARRRRSGSTRKNGNRLFASRFRSKRSAFPQSRRPAM